MERMESLEKFRKTIILVNSGIRGLFASGMDLGKNIKSVIKPEIELNKVYREKRTIIKVIPYDVYYQGNKAWVKYNDLNNSSQEKIDLNTFISCFEIEEKDQKDQKGTEEGQENG